MTLPSVRPDYRQSANLVQLFGESSAIGVNSTVTPLNDGQSFEGSWEFNAYPDMMFVCYTDQDCTLTVTFSPDGFNEDSILSYTISAGINEIHTLVKGPRYMKVTLSNSSGSNQTELRLYVFYGSFQKLTAQVDGTIRADSDGQIFLSPDSPINVARGFVVGREIWEKYGYNDDVDTGAEETIWPVGGTVTFLTAASTFTITSSSGNDDDGGTGARTLDIYYIDENKVDQVGTVTMNGVGDTVTPFSGFGINRARVATSGSVATNDGNITITATTGGTTQAYIAAGDGITHQTFFFIPANKQAIPFFFFLGATSSGAGKVVTLKLYSILENGTRLNIGRYQIDTDVQDSLAIESPASDPFPEKTIIELRASTSVDNTSVVGRVHFFLVGE